jgi:hypothetical protein
MSQSTQYLQLLKAPDKLENQIEFVSILRASWAEKEDPRMSVMYAEIESSLIRLRSLKKK